MIRRPHLPVWGIAAGIAAIIGGVAVIAPGFGNHPAPAKSASPAPRPETARTIFGSTPLPGGSRNHPPAFARTSRPNGHAAGVRARFSRLAQKDKLAAIDEALRLNATDRRLALATLALAWNNDSRRGFKELARIIEQMGIRPATARPGDLLNRPPDFRVAGQTGTVRLSKELGQSLSNLAAFSDDPTMPFLTMRLANRLLAPQKRALVLAAAAEAYAGIDPTLAFSLGGSLTGSDQQQFINSFSRGWANRDAEAAAQWATSIEEPSLRGTALGNAIDSFSRSDPARAAQWLGSLPDGPNRRAAIRELGGAWAAQDTAAALAWAGQLPDSTNQRQAIAAIQAVAPIGVGIAITRQDASGYPRAAEILPASPAAQSGGVRTGDQIVGILNEDQRWISTADLPIPQMISMIRGTAGAPVQLRLLPAGSSDPAQARTVTIVRQQILLRRTNSGG